MINVALVGSLRTVSSLPVDDWQFWLVSALAVAAVIAIVRPMLPSREKKAGCPGCGPAAPPRKTELTLDGRRVR